MICEFGITRKLNNKMCDECNDECKTHTISFAVQSVCSALPW